MVLLVDVGNTSIVLGFAEDYVIEKTYRFKTSPDKTADEYYILFKPLLDKYFADRVIISSVVPIVTSALKKMCDKYISKDVIIIGPGVKTGIQLKVDDPKTVGADMIADCAGAMKHYDEAIIIDLGTATKYIYVKNGIFYGCSIAPGVAISMKALVSNAALLPNIELVCPKKVIATNTITCMQSGVIFGAAAQVDGMIERIREELGKNDLPILATGGLSKLIVPLCKSNVELVELLTLEGLFEIYKKNVA